MKFTLSWPKRAQKPARRADFDIRWSAERAFSPVIRPSYRRVTARSTEAGGQVRTLSVTVLLEGSVDPATLEDIREDVSCAMTEIIADLPADTTLPLDDFVEDVFLVTGPLPPTDSADELIFERGNTR